MPPERGRGGEGEVGGWKRGGGKGREGERRGEKAKERKLLFLVSSYSQRTD